MSLEVLLQIINSQIGKHEDGDSNSGKDVEMYQHATNLKGTGWPWCAAFVDWCILQYLTKTDGVLTEKESSWRPKTASAFGELEWGADHGCKVKTRKQLAKAGDIVVFNFSHVGFVVEDQKSTSDNITTVEGNTSHSGSRDGGAVWKKSRPVSQVKGYVEWLPYVPTSPVSRTNTDNQDKQAPTKSSSIKEIPNNSKPPVSCKDIIQKIVDTMKDPRPGYNLDVFVNCMSEFCLIAGITPGPRLEYIMANIMFETGNLRVVVEEGPLSYFAYLDNRPELGNTSPGDGYKYRGRGPLQVTGKECYQHFGDILGIDLVNHPEWQEDTRIGCAVAVQFWIDRKMNQYCDQKLFTKVVKLIKGSLSDIDRRREVLRKIRDIIK